MKHRPIFAIPALLLGVAASCGVAQAQAQAQAQVLSTSGDFRKQASAVQSQLAKGDLAGASGALAALSPASAFEKYVAASLQLELSARRNDTRGQRSAVAAILSSGAMPADQAAYMRYLAGYFAVQAGAVDEALSHLLAARSLGYETPQSGLLLAEAYLRKRKPTEALGVFNRVLEQMDSAKQPVPPAWLDRAAALAYGQKDWAGFATYEARRLRMDSSPLDWRSAIVNYSNGAMPDAEAQLDLMRLQNATGALASERDYQGYAALATSLGNTQEAKAVADAGLSNGKLLTLAGPMAKGKQNLVSLAKSRSKAVTASASAADKLLSGSQYTQAATAYRAALSAGPANRDRNMTRLGIALARSGDIAGARTAFAQVGGKWRDIALLWDSWAALQAVSSAAPAPR
jgi:hypothetical protein